MTPTKREKEVGDERVADFFEPVQYPTMAEIDGRLMVQEYSRQTTADYDRHESQ